MRFLYVDPVPSRGYGGTQSADSPANPVTFSAMSFGAAGHRHVVVAISYLSTSAISAVTIGGVSASQVVAVANGSIRSELWIAFVASETSGNVVVSGHDGAASARAMAVSIYSLYDIKPTPTGSGSDTTSTYDISLTESAAGVAIGCFGSLVNGATSTWTNLTEDVDGSIVILGTDFHYTMASADQLAAGTPTVSVTPSVAGTAAFVAAAWGT